MSPKLSKQQLEQISDDLLDEMIEEQAKENFDILFYGLQEPLETLGLGNLFRAIEERINLIFIKIAEKAFEMGHDHGYGAAALDTIEGLRPFLAA